MGGRVIGFDPGKKSKKGDHSFAYSINDGSGNLLDSDYIETTLDTVTVEELESYRNEMFCLLEWMNIQDDDTIIIERFIPRPGRGMGSSAEYINLMISGLVYTLVDMGVAKDKIILVTASVWKTRFKKEFKGKLPPEIYPKVNGLDKHQADAFGMTAYVLLRREDLAKRQKEKDDKKLAREEKKLKQQKEKSRNSKK